AHARRIDDAVRRDRLDVDAAPFSLPPIPFPLVERAAVLAARDEQGGRLVENAVLPQPRFLADQLELVVVADDHARAGDAVAQFVAREPRALLPRIEDERHADRPALLGVLDHRAGIV